MIKATFKRKEKIIVGYELSGHAEFAKHGGDIVCSAVSALFLTITGELRLSAKVSQDSDCHSVRINERSLVSDTLVLALKNGLTKIADNYPENVQVEFVEE